MPHSHVERHRSDRIGWLRAAVLGANDGIISVASLVVGVAAAGATQDSLMLTGIAGLVAGAMSMAAGEYVSVKSQADTERADIERERRELERQPERELAEIAAIYEHRGLEPALARQVAVQLTAHDAVGTHARDELGITDALRARPFQAALASALSFVAGAAVPLAATLFAPATRVAAVSTAAIATLLLLGGVAAGIGGASVVRGALRVGAWGAAALALTTLAGKWFGAVV